MGDDGMFGFALGGLPEFEGKGGSGSEQRPREKEYEEAINGLLKQCGLDTLGPERAVELVSYAAEHQLDQWTELYDFFFNEAAALLLEAMEALDGGEGGNDEQQ